MSITTKTLAEIRRLNLEEKLNDAAIAERLGLKYGIVRYYRIKDGLPVQHRRYRNSCYKRYSVYNAHTSEFIVEGTAAECAQRLGITKDYFYIIVTRTRQGKSKTYEVHLVESENEPSISAPRHSLTGKEPS